MSAARKLPESARELHAQFAELSRVEMKKQLAEALAKLGNVVDADQAVKFALPHVMRVIDTYGKLSTSRALAREEQDREERDADHEPA